MLANYHTHTFRCKHAKGEDKEYVENAIRGGIKTLGFSDHCPWIFDGDFKSGIRMDLNEIDGYFKSLSDLRDEYKNDVKIYIGFECEYFPELMEKQDELLKNYPVDYLILGQHFNYREPYGPYTGLECDSEQELERYVDLIIDGMSTGRYRYIAHPDLFNFTGDREAYVRHYTRLCEFMKDNNYPLEFNYIGYMDNRHYPDKTFWEIAKSVGNKGIIGIDAHYPEMLSDVKAHKEFENFSKSFGLPMIDFLDGLE